MQKQESFKIESKRFINKQSRKRTAPLYPEKINVQFSYYFQDYLKFALAKIIPFPKVIIDTDANIIHGTRQDCSKLKNQCEEQLRKWSYKNLNFKKQLDIDQIDYLLDRQYEARFFSQGYTMRAIRALSQYSGLEEECQAFAERVKNKRVTIIKVNREYQSECLKKIYQIYEDKQKQPRKSTNEILEHGNSKLLNQTKETIVEQQSINYYKLLHQKKEQEKKSDMDSSLVSQLSTSSLSSFCDLTQTEKDASVSQDSLRTQNSIQSSFFSTR